MYPPTSQYAEQQRRMRAMQLKGDFGDGAPRLLAVFGRMLISIGESLVARVAAPVPTLVSTDG